MLMPTIWERMIQEQIPRRKHIRKAASRVDKVVEVMPRGNSIRTIKTPSSSVSQHYKCKKLRANFIIMMRFLVMLLMLRIELSPVSVFIVWEMLNIAIVMY